MDIYTVITEDHRKVKELMEDILHAQSERDREEMMLKLQQDILSHAISEERTFYARLRKDEKLKQTISHAEEEHEEVEDLLQELTTISPAGEEWMELFKEIKQSLEQHIRQEEKEVFPLARKIITTQEANELARKMNAAKRQMPHAA
jgi:hemerythrin superfamily protein